MHKFTAIGLGEGEHTQGLIATDRGGNVTTGSFGPIIIDRTDPTINFSRIATASDSGHDTADQITNVARPVIEATLTGAAQARISAPNNIGWSAVGPDGSWSFTPDFDLAGSYTIEARDLAGNTVDASGSYTYIPAFPRWCRSSPTCAWPRPPIAVPRAMASPMGRMGMSCSGM